MNLIHGLRSKRSHLYLLVLLVVWKVIDSLVSIVAQAKIPYLGFFSYGPTMYQYGMPDFVRALTNFDGIFYIRIANKGYEMTEQAYFPLYPLLLRGVTYVIQNPILSGLFISLAGYLIGIFLFKKYLGYLMDVKVIPWALLFLIAYPTSYYFGVLYTEGLFFALLVATLYFHKTGRYALAMITATGASMTKVVGTTVLIPIGISFLYAILVPRVHTMRELFVRAISQWKSILVMFSSLLGVGLYAGYLGRVMGDPLYFIRAQESFGANRSSHLVTPFQVLYRYVRIFVTADYNFQYVVAIIECIFYVATASLILYEIWNLWKRYKKEKKVAAERLGLALFSGVNILIPSLTGTLTAMPRYSLMSLSIYLVLGEIRNVKVKVILIALFVVIHMVFFALFTQGYYVT